MLTCDNCLKGKSWRCDGPSCAQWAQRVPRTRPRRSTAGQKRTRKPTPYVPTGRRPGRPSMSTLPPPMQRAIADSIVEGMPMAEIARRSGATYEQVRTVQRQLHKLTQEAQAA